MVNSCQALLPTFEARYEVVAHELMQCRLFRIPSPDIVAIGGDIRRWIKLKSRQL